MPCAACGGWVAQPDWLNLGPLPSNAVPAVLASKRDEAGNLLICYCEVCLLLEDIQTLHCEANRAGRQQLLRELASNLRLVRAQLRQRMPWTSVRSDAPQTGVSVVQPVNSVFRR